MFNEMIKDEKLNNMQWQFTGYVTEDNGQYFAVIEMHCVDLNHSEQYMSEAFDDQKDATDQVLKSLNGMKEICKNPTEIQKHFIS